MKINLLLFCFLTIPVSVLAQKNFNYTGFIVLDSSGSVYPYTLTFKENKHLIEGFSVTNANFPDETRNKISGFSDKKNKKIDIKELLILETSTTSVPIPKIIIYNHLAYIFSSI